MKISTLLKILLIGALPFYAVDGGEGGTDDSGDAGTDDATDKDTDDASDTSDKSGDSEDKTDDKSTDDKKSDDKSDDKSKDDKENKDDDSAVDFAKIELPEGMTLDESVVERFSPIIKDMELNQEQLQKLATGFAELRQADAADRVEAFSQQKADWFKAAESDKEFGGDKFEESAKLAVQAVDKFGTPELRQFMDDYGIGNHPELIRFMVKVGQATKEDTPGGGNNNTNTVVKDKASILYPEATQ